MQLIGMINNRQIYYSNIRKDMDWFQKLPFGNWCAFTIADDEDIELIDFVVAKCIDNQVVYTCSSGKLAEYTEDFFDEKIVNGGIFLEDKTGEPYNYEQSPITTMHKNFSEGFWFSTVLAYSENKDISKVVCIDLTIRGVKNRIVKLIEKINIG